MKIRKAIIPAAGLGTRFLPATKALPKEMLPILGKPAIQYIVEEAAASGIEEILIISGRHKRAIEDHFDKAFELEEILRVRGRYDLLETIEDVGRDMNIHYIRQREPLGLGHAVLCAKTFIGDEPFALLLGDDIVESETPCTAQCIREYEKHRTTVIGVQAVKEEEVHKYGIIRTKGNYPRTGETVLIDGLVEKPDPAASPSRFAIMGRYIIEPAIFSILERQSPDRNGEIQLTEALNVLNSYKPIGAYAFWGRRFDVGDPAGFLKANVAMAMKDETLRTALLEVLEEELSIKEGGVLR